VPLRVLRVRRVRRVRRASCLYGVTLRADSGASGVARLKLPYDSLPSPVYGCQILPKKKLGETAICAILHRSDTYRHRYLNRVVNEPLNLHQNLEYAYSGSFRARLRS
jgi:hypothetical protein